VVSRTRCRDSDGSVLLTRRFGQSDLADWGACIAKAPSTRLSVASSVYNVGNYFAGDPFHVTFVSEPDGSLRSLEIMGAEHLAVAVSPAYYERCGDDLGEYGRTVTVLLERELLVLQRLAERASTYFPGYGTDEDTVAEIAFVSGAPL
jgi:hypothetical protein